MIETKMTQIGDYHYQVTQLGSTEGRRLLAVLLKTVGPSLAELFKHGKLGDAPTSVLAEAVERLAIDLDPDSFELNILAPLEAKTKFAPLDAPNRWLPISGDLTHWSGRFASMLIWLRFSLEANYADFFGLLDRLKGGSLVGPATEKRGE